MIGINWAGGLTAAGGPGTMAASMEMVMHYTINFSKSPAPAHDAVQAIKEWFGLKWDEISPLMAQIKSQESFALYAELAGISGYPVKAWWELYHGQGSWRD